MIKRDVDRDNPTRINYTREGFPVSSLARRRGAGRGKKVEKRRRWRKRAIKMAKLFASKESRLARSGNGLAAGYGTLLPSYWYANVHLFPRVLEKDGHLSLSLFRFFVRSQRLIREHRLHDLLGIFWNVRRIRWNAIVSMYLKKCKRCNRFYKLH